MTSLIKSFRNKKTTKNSNNLTVANNSQQSNSLINIDNNKQQSNPPHPTNTINKNIEIHLSDLPLDVKHNLFAKLPNYSGTQSENFTMFIAILESKTDPLNIAENDKLILLQYCLMDKAAEAYIKISQQQTTVTWKNMINLLQKSLPVENDINYRTLHQRKQQNSETLEEYAHLIQQMINKLYPNQNGFSQKCRNMEMVKVFKNGIQQPLKRQLKQKTYMDLNEALQEAKILQHQYLQQQHHNGNGYERP